MEPSNKIEEEVSTRNFVSFEHEGIVSSPSH
jgi:hypothetical protein